VSEDCQVLDRLGSPTRATQRGPASALPCLESPRCACAGAPAVEIGRALLGRVAAVQSERPTLRLLPAPASLELRDGDLRWQAAQMTALGGCSRRSCRSCCTGGSAASATPEDGDLRAAQLARTGRDRMTARADDPDGDVRRATLSCFMAHRPGARARCAARAGAARSHPAWRVSH
jgi:hypothetical protein